MSLILKTETMNLKPYIEVNSNNLYISKEAWKDINDSYSKEEIKKAIAEAIDYHKIIMPMDKISLQEAKDDFKELSNLNASNLLKQGKTFTRYDYKYEISDLYIDSCNVGNKSSNYFHQYNRFLCDSINAPSPFRSWHLPKFRDTLLNCLWTLKFEQIDFKTLRTGLHLRKYVASQFRPSAAKLIYSMFKSKDVLDFSSGWGDRLNAFLSCANTESYFGIDPNTNLYQGYNQQIQEFNTNKKISMNHGCSEDIKIPENSFDTVFTSPPYFNIERYTQEPNQSWKKYKKIDSWLNDFLFVTLDKAWKGLKTNGVMIVNISDVYSNHTINRMCDPMNDFISKLPNASYHKTIGLRMAKRPNSNADKDGVFVEPMWIWKKN